MTTELQDISKMENSFSLLSVLLMLFSVSYDSKSTSCDRDLSEGCTTCSDSLKTSIKCNFVREFFCPKSALNLPVKGSTLDLFFLPFEMHLRYCIVILSSRKIGEILYILEGKGIIPLPSHFPKPVPIQHNLNSSDEAFNKDDPVLYLKCKLGEILRTDILFPLMNDAKERAFAFAAKQQMSRMEYDRRSITGTLESSSVRVAIALLGLTKVECSTYFNTSQLKRPKTILYSVEISFPEYFSIPSKIYIPQIPESRTEHSELHGLKLEHKSEPDASIAVPLQFFPLSAGRYPCEILLKSKYDVRIFQIEGVVDEERAEGRFEFQTRAFEAITQNIPVINRSDKDWKCRAEIQGDWFSGPSVIHIESQKIKDYPLTFKPILECEIMGKLILINEVDTSEHVFEIKGVAKSPLPTEKLFVDCRVGNEIRRTITVPNYTKTALTYKVVSDLSMVWGAPFITVEANSKVPYALHIKPKKSGKFTGKIIFTVVDKEDIISQRELYAGQYDSYIGKIASIPSSMLVKSEQVSALKNLKFWYSVDINSVPGYPTHTLEIECISLERQRIDIPLCNTQARIFHIDVLLSSPALSGSKEIVLFSEEQKNYSIFIIPVTTGYSEEKVIFQPEDSREFWYLLKLKTKPPKPTTIAEIQCELGKFVSQIITLNNPSHETLVISGQSTNPINFVLDMSKGPLIIDPFSTGKISFKFCPSSLGRNNQRGSLIFSCSQIEEWTFNVSGVGLYPTPISTEKASTFLDTHKTITIPFQNPTLEEVIIDITLSNRDKTKKYFLDPKWSSFFSRSSGFKFSKSMTQTQGIKLPPKGTIDITMIFYPRDMKLYKSLVIIQMIKANNELWHIDNFNELNSDMKRNIGTDRENIAVIQWLYPFLGLSEAEYPQQCVAVLKGKAKKRIEDVLVVSLDGDYSRGRPIYEPNDFVVLPENSTRDSSYEDLLGETAVFNREYEILKKGNLRIASTGCDAGHSIDIQDKRQFKFKVEFESEDIKSRVEPYFTVYLLDKAFNISIEQITLMFALIFIPMKPVRTRINLKIESEIDGIWRYPIFLNVEQPDVDGIVDIEAVGLNKESSVELRLKSTSRNPQPFTAYFLSKTSDEIFVIPDKGVIQPHQSETGIITIGFKPCDYGKIYKAELAIEMEDEYWLYEVNGIPPPSGPSKDTKAKVDCRNKAYDNKTTKVNNFIQKNVKLVKAKLSCTSKDSPLTLKNK